MTLKACLFDMGNVLVEFCHERMLQQMAEVCGSEAQTLRELLFDSGRLLQYEKGKITDEELHQLIETNFARTIDRAHLTHAASDIFQEKTEMIPLLTELRQLNMRLVLLSNTSRIHFEFIKERFEILSYFDDYVLSYEVQALKPEAEIYQAAVRAAGVPAEHCFFTDDILDNIIAARENGLHAEQFHSREQITDVLRGYHLPLSAEI